MASFEASFTCLFSILSKEGRDQEQSSFVFCLYAFKKEKQYCITTSTGWLACSRQKSLQLQGNLFVAELSYRVTSNVARG